MVGTLAPTTSYMARCVDLGKKFSDGSAVGPVDSSPSPEFPGHAPSYPKERLGRKREYRGAASNRNVQLLTHENAMDCRKEAF
jgi:hypothetical protein